MRFIFFIVADSHLFQRMFAAFIPCNPVLKNYDIVCTNYS